jgi:tripartite-type tricarboxylate transporter receptor subunit TctC
MALCVHSDVPARSVAELIELAKGKPGGLNFSSAGLGATSHLATELFMSMTGVRMTHVPYRAGSQAVQAVVAGDVQLAFVDAHVARTLAANGRVHVLGVTSLARHPSLPDVPTVSETLSGFEMATTTGLFAPRGVRPDILLRMERDVIETMRRRDVQDQFLAASFQVLAQGHEGLAAHVQSESDKWGKVIRDRGIKLP